MSKFRPLDYKCGKCGTGVVSASFWYSGQYNTIDSVRKLGSKGYWVLECKSCNFTDKYTP